MAPTGYTVASAATLLGAKPPKRREIEDVYFARMAAADKQNREQSQLQRAPEVKRKEGEKKVRSTPSTVSITGAMRSTNISAARGAMVDDQDEDEDTDETQAEGVIPRTGTTDVSSPSLFISPRPSNTSGNTKAIPRQGPRDLTALPRTATSSANKECRPTTQPSTFPALPFVHSHRLNANSTASNPTGRIRLEISGRSQNDDDTDSDTAAGYTASAASSSSHSRGGRSQDIFFTPTDVNRSNIEFEFFNANAQMSAPRVLGSDDSFERGESSRSSDSPLLSKGKEAQYQYSQARKQSYDGRSRRRESLAKKKEKITVSPEQLDRLIVGLANAPLIQTHLRKQWLEGEEIEQKGNPSLLSLRSALQQTKPPSNSSIPSLTNSEAATESSSSLYSRANTTFIDDAGIEHDDEEDSQASTEHPLTRNRPRVNFGGIALTDPKVHGAPIRFISKGYKKGANVLQVGQCSFLNVPYGASVDCILRIEPGDVANGGAACSVTVQVMSQVLERRKGRKVYLLVAEVDVTESLTKAVLVELSQHTGISLENIDVVRPEPIRRDSVRESVDWCALADELQTVSSTNEIIENTASSFKNLDAEKCSMQTLTLLSELERIKAQHVDFLVLRATSTSHDNGMPTGIGIPWISQHLDRHVNLWSPEASSLFREDLVAAVGRRHADGNPFAVRVLWGRKKKIVRCVPLLEGEAGKTAGWVAFVGDEFDF